MSVCNLNEFVGQSYGVPLKIRDGVVLQVVILFSRVRSDSCPGATKTVVGYQVAKDKIRMFQNLEEAVSYFNSYFATNEDWVKVVEGKVEPLGVKG